MTTQLTTIQNQLALGHSITWHGSDGLYESNPIDLGTNEIDGYNVNIQLVLRVSARIDQIKVEQRYNIKIYDGSTVIGDNRGCQYAGLQVAIAGTRRWLRNYGYVR